MNISKLPVLFTKPLTNSTRNYHENEFCEIVPTIENDNQIP